MSFDYLNVFKRNEHTEDYHIRKTNDENFFSKLEIKKLFTWEEKYLISKQII